MLLLRRGDPDDDGRGEEGRGDGVGEPVAAEVDSGEGGEGRGDEKEKSRGPWTDGAGKTQEDAEGRGGMSGGEAPEVRLEEAAAFGRRHEGEPVERAGARDIGACAHEDGLKDLDEKTGEDARQEGIGDGAFPLSATEGEGEVSEAGQERIDDLAFSEDVGGLEEGREDGRPLEGPEDDGVDGHQGEDTGESCEEEKKGGTAGPGGVSGPGKADKHHQGGEGHEEIEGGAIGHRHGRNICADSGDRQGRVWPWGAAPV